jgi:hypothetical protein
LAETVPEGIKVRGNLTYENVLVISTMHMATQFLSEWLNTLPTFQGGTQGRTGYPGRDSGQQEERGDPGRKKERESGERGIQRRTQ